MLTPITLTTTLCSLSPLTFPPPPSPLSLQQSSRRPLQRFLCSDQPPTPPLSLPPRLLVHPLHSPNLSHNVSSSFPSCTGGAKQQPAEESKLDLKCFPRALSRATGAQPLSEGEVPWCRAHCRTAQRAHHTATLRQSSKFRALLECSRTGGGRQPAGPGAPSSSSSSFSSSSSSSSFSSHFILLDHQPSNCSSKLSTLQKSDWTSP